VAAVAVAGAEEALVVEAAAGEAEAALAVVAAGVVDVVAAGVEVEVDVEELRATTTNAIKMIAATTATTTRLDDFVAGLEFLAGAAATAFADFPAPETAALVDDPRVGTGGITIVEEADFLATFFALFLTALFLTVAFLATFFAGLFFAVVFLTTDFFAVFLAVVFLTAVFLAVVFFAADFFAVFFTAVFLAVVFFTATG